jgi:2',3'-cyclic-nucleotide 2'-phosphodiesterase (5'-nucleotidase family)
MPIDRRHVLFGIGAASTLPLVGRASAQAPADLVVIVLSDLHSAYERMAQTLAGIERVATGAGAPLLIVINGDVFERGNVVALRSEGALDWAFLDALRRFGPVVLNLGNHETALVDDLSVTVRRASELGLGVVSNLIDRRTGRPFAAPSLDLDVGGRPVTIAGVATDEIMTYRQVVRPTLEIPEPGAYGVGVVPGLSRPGRFHVVLSHAGVLADRRMLPALPDGTLLVGGHEHLDFRLERGATRYLHTGSWHRAFTVVRARLSGHTPAMTVERVAVAEDGPADPVFAANIRATLARHLTDEERVVVGRSARALDLGETGRALAAAMARAATADVGLMSHTTLGTGLPAGEVTRFAMAATIRFDGGLVAAEIDAATLRSIYELANQDRDVPLDRRIGDFVYANEIPVTGERRYRVVTNGWTRLNAARYLGTNRIVFAEIQTPTIRAILANALT